MGLAGIQHCVHPRNLTWNLKIMVSKWTFLFQGLIFRFHVKFWDFGGVHLIAFVCCLEPRCLPNSSARHGIFCRCTARGRSGVFDKVRRLVHTSSETQKISTKNLQTTRESQFFFRFWKQYSMPMDEFHTPSRGVYFQVLEVHSQQFKLCGRGWFVSLGEMVCFFDAKSFHTFSFLSVQNWYSKSFRSVGIEKMLENKHVHTTGSHHMRVLFFQADGPLDTVL